MAAIYTERRQFRDAAQCLEEAVAQAPADGAVHYQLGLAYRETGENRKAAEEFRAAMDHGFRNLAVKFHRIAALFASRQSTEGLEVSREIIRETPHAPDLLVRLGRLLFDRLYYREALSAFRLAHEQQPEAFEPAFYLALTHYLLNQYNEAATLLDPLVSAGATPETVNLLAASEAESGRIAVASKRLAETIAKSPRSPHAYLNLALMRLEEERADEAEELLGQFRALGPQPDAKVFYSVKRNGCPALVREMQTEGEVHADREKAEFYFDLATQMQARFHHSTAIELLRLTRRYEGNSPRLLHASGMSCLNLSSPSPEAVWLLGQAVAADKGDPDSWYLLGKAYKQQGSSEEAVAAFRNAARLAERAGYWIALGKAVTAEDQAQAAFEKALALDSDNAMAHFELGRLFSQSGQFEKARMHLARAVELEPDFYEAYYALGRVYARTGEREQSQKYLALFERTKRAALEQAVAGSGYIAGSHDQ